MPKCGQTGAMRSGLACAILSSCRLSGWPATASTSTASPGRAPATKTGSAPRSTTPSPWWPRRSITRRSTTLGLDQKLAVAIAAQDRRRHDPANPPLQRGQKCGDVAADRRVNGGVTDDALFDGAACRFELRLDQCDKRGAWGEQFAGCRQHEFQRNKAHVDSGEIGSLRKSRRIERANIGLLE